MSPNKKIDDRFVNDGLYRHKGNPLCPGHDANGFKNILNIEDSDFLLTGSSHIYGSTLKYLNGIYEDGVGLELQKTGLKIYNASMGSWSPMQYALVSRDYYNSEKQNAIIIGLYLGFDVYAALKHSIELNSDFSKRFVSRNHIEPVDLSWRNARNKTILEMMRNGHGVVEAMAAAHKLGVPDSEAIFFNGHRYFIEPKLRLALMDVDSPFISNALLASVEYFKFIIDCVGDASKVLVLLLPTKESVLYSLVGDQYDNKCFENSKKSEDLMKHSLVREFDRLGLISIDCLPIYLENIDKGIFDPDVDDGHINSSGHSVVSDVIRQYIS